MNLRVSMIIMSHLSDVQELISMSGNPLHQQRRIDFAKFLILKHKDTSVEVNPNDEYALFIAKFPDKKFQ